MKPYLALLLIAVAHSLASGQSSFQLMVDADRAIANAAVQNGTRSAYLVYLADDGVIFHPDAVNGKDYWNLHKQEPPVILKRAMERADRVRVKSCGIEVLHPCWRRLLSTFFKAGY